MLYGTVPGIKKQISRLVLGTMIISDGEPSPPGTEYPFLGKDASFKLLDGVVSHGGNAFDSAHVYGVDGASEKGLGLWMKDRGNREQVVIATKGGIHPSDDLRLTTEFIREDIDESLRRLQSDFIDLYILHHDEPRLDVETIVDFMNEELDSGRIHAYGVSNWSVDRIRAATAYAGKGGLSPPVANQPHYSLAEQVESPWGKGCTSLSGPTKAADRDWHRESNMGIFSYSSLARGFFSGRVTRENYDQEPGVVDKACRKAYCHEVNFQRLDRATELARHRNITVPSVAVAFLFTSGLNTFPVFGAASIGEFADLCDGLSIPLSPEERAWLDLETDVSPI